MVARLRLAVAVGFLLCGSAFAATNVAVFNFQMTSETPEWRWLEKGLSDRIATDFHQDASLSVVARDEMQLLAQKMDWVPEFATTDPERMKQIKRQLRIEYLATGVYRVADGRIHITGQIVDVEDRTEVARGEVEGRLDEVIDLQRRLSAELLAWFVKRPAPEILARLPVWTRSVPAMRALYDGMDLYDQGRYAEAWLKFRQASREDSQYAEAVYWVGKMYYFMNRYEHARRELERFVYLDAAHPRLGDAVVEYVHTYESRDVPAETLLALYEDLSRRFAETDISDLSPWNRRYRISDEKWWLHKQAVVLGHIGRHREAAVLMQPILYTDGTPRGSRSGVLNVMEHHALTGEIFEPQVLMEPKYRVDRLAMLYFGPDAQAQVGKLGQPKRLLGRARRNLDKQAVFDRDHLSFSMLLVVPEGHAFKSLRFHPVAEGDDGVLEVTLRIPGTYSNSEPQTSSVRDARARGTLCARLPRAGILSATCKFRLENPQDGPLIVRGVRVVPELEKVDPCGAISVSCADTPNLRVYVDGQFARWFPGTVGPLSAGIHTLELRPNEAGAPYEPWTTPVEVRPGQVTRVVGRLPWSKDSGWSDWTTTCVGRESPSCDLWGMGSAAAPAVYTDGEAIRLIWARGGDLWASLSTDGQAFSTPYKLRLPVSSAWLETHPRLSRDEAGRFVLWFTSDRDAQHRSLLYRCWSRDFVHWSAPSRVTGRSARWGYRVFQDKGGRFIRTERAGNVTRLMAGRDGQRWEKLGEVAWTARRVSLLQRDDGRFELLGWERMAPRETPSDRITTSRLVRSVSADGREWSEPEVVAQWDDKGWPYFSTVHAKGRTLILARKSTRAKLESRIYLIGETEEGTWQKTPDIPGLLDGPTTLAYHPRWGYLIAWMTSERSFWSRPPSRYGPYLLRGESIEAVLRAQRPSPTVEVVEKRPSHKTQIVTVTRPDGRPALQTIFTKPEEIKKWGDPRPQVSDVPGELTYVPCPPQEAIGNRGIVLEGMEHFHKAKPNTGTVNPNALVTTARQNSLLVSVALDSEAVDNPHFDVLRLDFTGKEDFRSAYVVPRCELVSRGSLKEFAYIFEKQPCNVLLGDQPRSIDFAADFCERPDFRRLNVRLGTCAEGTCRFGDRLHKVRLIDGTSNLRVDDPAKPILDGGWIARSAIGDTVQVQVGDEDEDKWVAAFYGHPVLVDGRLWNMTVSKDGTKIGAEPYGGPTGMVHFDHPFWRAMFVGEENIVLLRGGPEPVPMPAGPHRLLHYRERQSADPKGWRLELTIYAGREGPEGLETIDVAAGKTVGVTIGSPLLCRLAAAQTGNTVRFKFTWTDISGKPASHLGLDTPNRSGARAPKIDIFGPDGRRVARRKMEWQWSRTATAEWEIPEGLSGSFTATLAWDTGGIPFKAEKTTFEIR